MMLKLKLGTKIIVSVGLIVFFCMLALLFVVTINVDKAETKITQKLLTTIASESKEIVDNAINGTYIPLSGIQARLEELLEKGSGEATQELLVAQVKNVLDMNTSGVYAYLYITDPRYTGTNIANPKYKTENGEFLVITKDLDPSSIGGVEVLESDAAVLKFGSVQKTLRTGKASIGNPSYVDIAHEGNKFGFGINIPLKVRGELKGLIGIFIDLNEISARLLDPSLSAFDTDYRSIISDDFTIAVHPDSKLLGANFKEINSHPSAISLLKAFNDRTDGLYEYTNYEGEEMLAEFKSFEVGIDTGTFWNVLVIAPKASVYESLHRLQNIVIAMICASLLIIMTFVYFYVKFNVTSRINVISKHLFAFFACLRHEDDKCPAPLKPKSEDELGAMVLAINKGIDEIQDHLQQDSALV
ncbi:PDC sensor domain-containing protein, partial [Helicobacter equorum]